MWVPKFADDHFELGQLGEHHVADGLALARDASTIIVVSFAGSRSSAVSSYAVLLLRRSDALDFAPGAWVFPGGSVAAEDVVQGDNVVSLRATACRECLEETGLHVEPDSLVPLSRWITPPGRSRRFDTRFFVSIVEDVDHPTVTIDNREIVDHKWLTPADALDQYGDAMLPPTRATLQQLPMTDLATFRSWLDELTLQ